MNKSETVPIGRLGTEELLDFINVFPALLWRIDLINNKIEYLNAYRIEGLGANSGLLLQNSEFRRQMVFEDDIYLLEEFMQTVRKGEMAATLFRLKTRGGAVRWIKVTGVPNPKTPHLYIGYMLDVTHTANIVQSIAESDAEMEAMIELAKDPAMLIDPGDRTIAAHNAAARDTFQYRSSELNGINVSELLHPSVDPLLQRVYEDLIFDKKWEGRLVFKRKDRSIFAGDVTMRFLILKGRRLYRATIHNILVDASSAMGADGQYPDRGPMQDARHQHSRMLTSRIKPIQSVTKALQILLEHQFGDQHFDAIMYSDIYAKKNRVVVYYAGRSFQALPQGEVFAYEGTIAENINRFQLDHLIVENTFASIKAIDWALFIPHGIRSYFAKPFYERRVMRSVLILCSEHSKHFSAAHVDDYAVYDAPFLKALKNWRSARKKR